jgi:hypothetical protein
MRQLDWSKYPDFSPEEFPEDPNAYASEYLLATLQSARSALKVPIYPSPAPGALARFDRTTSMHFCDPDKYEYSKAVDFFVAGNPVDAFYKLVMSRTFYRIGVYFDTRYRGQNWVMFHGDNGYSNLTRLWFRDKGKYYYPRYTPGKGGDYLLFLNLLQSRVYDNNKK